MKLESDLAEIQQKAVKTVTVRGEYPVLIREDATEETLLVVELMRESLTGSETQQRVAAWIWPAGETQIKVAVKIPKIGKFADRKFMLRYNTFVASPDDSVMTKEQSCTSNVFCVVSHSSQRGIRKK